MTRKTPVNPPVPGMVPHPGFPAGMDMDVLVKARAVFRWAADEAGFKEVGCGFGVRDETDGEADIGLEIDGRNVEVRIYLPKPERK